MGEKDPETLEKSDGIKDEKVVLLPAVASRGKTRTGIENLGWPVTGRFR